MVNLTTREISNYSRDNCVYGDLVSGQIQACLMNTLYWESDPSDQGFFLGAFVAQESALLTKHMVFVSSSHVSSSFPGQAATPGFPVHKFQQTLLSHMESLGLALGFLSTFPSQLTHLGMQTDLRSHTSVFIPECLFPVCFWAFFGAIPSRKSAIAAFSIVCNFYIYFSLLVW